MTDHYMLELLRVAAAQVCQTIGYHATQQAPLELLQDTLHKFLHEFARDLRRQVEHYNRTEANLDDACLTLNSLNINVSDLLDYVNNVEAVPFSVELPKFPAPKVNNLNFLKPGSKEVLTRPVHIYEHLPPMLPPETSNAGSVSNTPHYMQNSNASEKQGTGMLTYNYNGSGSDDTKPQKLLAKGELSPPGSGKRLSETKETMAASFLKTAATNTGALSLLDEEGRPTREISSVVMTTGGFISPAIEGKLPDAIIPDLIEKLQGFDAPPPPPPPPSLIPCAAATVPSTDSQQNGKSATNSQATNVKSDVCEPTASKIATPTPATTSKTPSGASMKETVKKIETNAVCPDTTTEDNVSASSSMPATAVSSKKGAQMHYGAAHLPQPSTLASKLLKKAKKKSTPQNAFPKLRNLIEGGMDAVAMPVEPTTDKAQRKRRKMMEKLVKNVGLNKMNEVFANFDDFKSMKDPELEKLRKKGRKHRQKMLLQLKASNKHQPLSDAFPLGLASPVDLTSTGKISPSLKDSKSPQNIGKETSMSSLAVMPHIAHTTQTQQQKKSSSILDTNMLAGRKISEDEMKAEPSLLEAENVRKTLPETKLSTEPDRSKLNIFKKISKQKTPKPLSPNRMLPNHIYGSSGESPIISLPSGTTITPAPASVGRHAYPPNANNITGMDSSSKKVLSNDMAVPHDLSCATAVHGNASLSGVSLLEEGDALKKDATNKPKKRGRKPGSKNHPKVPFKGQADSSNETSPVKKTKKLKVNKLVPTFPEMNPDIWNAGSYKQAYANAGATDISPPWANESNLFPMFNPIALQQQALTSPVKAARKERKKMKLKNSPHPVMPNIASFEKIQNVVERSINVPTKEEVNTINKKLMRMDTVLKPAPPLTPFGSSPQPSTSFTKRYPEHPEDVNVQMQSPTKLITPNKSPGSKKRALQRLQQQISPDIRPKLAQPPQPSNLFMPTPNPGIQNLPAIFKYYSFPRPGLIPSLIPNSPNAAAQNMFLPPFMHFPNIKTPPNTKINPQEIDYSSKTEKFPESLPQLDNERNYCNVAPLVPESMKLTPPDTKQERSASDKDYPRTPKVRQSPTLNELSHDTLLKKLETIGTPDSALASSRSVPVTPGGMSIESLSHLNADKPASNMSTPTVSEKSSFASNIFSQSQFPVQKTGNLQYSTSALSAATPLNPDDPIEVSDDSVDAPPKQTSPNLSTPPQPSKSRLHQSLLKPNTPGVGHLGDIFTSNTSSGSSMKTSATGDMDLSPKDGKKQKKANKLAKSSKNSFTSPPSTTYGLTALDMFNTEKGGVGKLAGGADLIPLTSTGLAYSAKSVPATSLTGVLTPQMVMPNKDFTTPNILDSTPMNLNSDMNLSVSITDPQKRKKEHKKLKKLKEDKIKRKKDKKDKSKSKERMEKYLHKSEKVLGKDRPYLDSTDITNKDILKKLKKELKKKHKHAADDLASSQYESPNSLELTPFGFARNMAGVTSPSSYATTNFTATSTPTMSATLVPKLTLKLGTSQSPTPPDDTTQRYNPNTSVVSSTERSKKREPSPELARISPLVTRPPKQKLSISDSGPITASTLNASAIGATTGTIEAASDTGTKMPSSTVSTAHALVPPPSPWLQGGTLAASSVLLPQQLLQSAKAQEHSTAGTAGAHKNESSSGSTAETVASVPTTSTTRTAADEHQNPVSLITETSRPSSYIDAEGNRVWICPACGKVDDGSPMIGCDGCDAWYHWVCVGISVAPKDNEDWFCRVCITRKRGAHGADKKRKRSKKR